MARLVVLTDDLLFGSRVLGGLQAAGHDAVLAGDLDAARGSLPGTELLILDLTAKAGERIAAARELARPGLRTMAFYSHVEADVRAAAMQAGVDLVIPRSRMAREGVALAESLLAARDEA